ncbi:hypothetical protein L6452_19711 [Arctium lappa]|uniref:Uncharacterized protein n=1 Tax=Arctium lappa TaxID=4217 RepID=A0ACB9B9V6_ARCLA|nr:hypothetical protein L6452_19711 [Arctium lappa]
MLQFLIIVTTFWCNFVCICLHPTNRFHGGAWGVAQKTNPTPPSFTFSSEINHSSPSAPLIDSSPWFSVVRRYSHSRLLLESLKRQALPLLQSQFPLKSAYSSPSAPLIDSSPWFFVVRRYSHSRLLPESSCCGVLWCPAVSWFSIEKTDGLLAS